MRLVRYLEKTFKIKVILCIYNFFVLYYLQNLQNLTTKPKNFKNPIDIKLAYSGLHHSRTKQFVNSTNTLRL